MDFFNNKKNIRTILLLILFTAVTFTVILNFTVVFQTLGVLFGILTPLFMGLCIAFVLNVLLNFYERRAFAFLQRRKRRWLQKLCRPVSLIATFLTLGAAVTLIVLFIIPKIAVAFGDLGTNLPNYINSLFNTVTPFLQNAGMPEDMLPAFQEEDGAVAALIRFFLGSSDQIWKSVSSLIPTFFGKLLDIVFAIVIALYVLLQKEMVSAFTRKLFHAFLPEKRYRRLGDFAILTSRSFSRFLTGAFIEALILGTLSFLGMFLIGRITDFIPVSTAVLIAVMIAIGQLIPFVGAFIAGGAGALIILVQNPTNPKMALIFLIFLVCVQQFEGNLIYPKVVGKSVGLPGVTVLIAVSIGNKISGIVGMLFSVPLCSVCYALLTQWMQSRLEKKTLRQGGENADPSALSHSSVEDITLQSLMASLMQDDIPPVDGTEPAEPQPAPARRRSRRLFREKTEDPETKTPSDTPRGESLPQKSGDDSTQDMP